MEIIEYLQNFEKGIFAFTGPAGSGKSFLSQKTASHFKNIPYQIDYRFIGTSEDRKNLLFKKQTESFESYIDAANQFNWWDWDLVSEDIQKLLNFESLIIRKPYLRDTGLHSENTGIEIDCRNKFHFFDGAILGPPKILNYFRKIIYIVEDEQIRFKRLLDKDIFRRSFLEILARFLITEYSETIYYNNLFKHESGKLVFVDCNGNLLGSHTLNTKNLYLPIKIGD